MPLHTFLYLNNQEDTFELDCVYSCDRTSLGSVGCCSPQISPGKHSEPVGVQRPPFSPIEAEGLAADLQDTHHR